MPKKAKKRDRRRNPQGDFLSFVVDAPKEGKWVTDYLIWGRRIGLYGVSMAISVIKEKVHVNPVIPNLSGALKLLKENPKASDIYFDKGEFSWKLFERPASPKQTWST